LGQGFLGSDLDVGFFWLGYLSLEDKGVLYTVVLVLGQFRAWAAVRENSDCQASKPEGVWIKLGSYGHGEPESSD
jgi:hypothetical protein